MPEPCQPGKSRRTFLKSAGAAALAPCAFRIIPASALGADGTTAPSNRIALGLIGIGMVGQGHLQGFLQAAEAQVVAVCDVDRWRRENAQATTEQAYADRRTSGVYRGCAAYNDLRDLLAREDIDAVRDRLQDFAFFRRFSYDCRQVFDGDRRWSRPAHPSPMPALPACARPCRCAWCRSGGPSRR